MSLETFVLRMPKVELDVHLEAALRPASLLILAGKHGVELPAPAEPGLRRWLQVRGFESLEERQRTICSCLRSGEDFHLLAMEYAAEAAVQNVVYCEVQIAVSLHLGNGVDPEEMGQALAEAGREAEARYGLKLRLLPALHRRCDAAAAEAVLQWSLLGPAAGLVAGVAAWAEDAASNEALHRFFSAAGRAGLGRVVQAGAGLGGVPEALEGSAVERLSQAVQVAGSPPLLRRLEQRRLPLVLSPTSGWFLGQVPEPDRHPFDRLYRQGLRICVNSDRPQLLDTNLAREYVRLHRAFGYDATLLASLSLAGVVSSFLPEGERKELEQGFKEELLRLGEKYLGSPVRVGS